MPPTSPASSDAQKKRTTKSLEAAVPLPPPPQPDEDDGVAPIVLEEGLEEKQYFHGYVLMVIISYKIIMCYFSDRYHVMTLN